MKNILLIIPNMDFGGAQRSFSKLSMGLSEKYNVINVVFNQADGVVYPLGGKLISLDIKASTSLLSKAVSFFQRISKISKIKRQHNIDVSISFLEGADFVNILSKGSEKIVISIRGSKHSDETIQGFIGWLRKKILIPFLYQKVDTITTVNKGIVYELDHFFGLSNIKKKVIYNYYDMESISKMAAQDLPVGYKAVGDKPYLVFSGRLAPEKGIDKLLLVFSRMEVKHDSRFVIVGNGPMKSTLKDLCKELGLRFSEEYKEESDVIFVGEQRNPHAFVSRASMLVMASSSEGFPNGLVEAMTCKTPVVSTDCPWGPREILSERMASALPEYSDYGILLPMLNVESKALEDAVRIWAKVLDNLMKNEQLCQEYSLKGFNRVKQYNQEKHFALWDELINE